MNNGENCTDQMCTNAQLCDGRILQGILAAAVLSVILLGVSVLLRFVSLFFMMYQTRKLKKYIYERTEEQKRTMKNLRKYTETTPEESNNSASTTFEDNHELKNDGKPMDDENMGGDTVAIKHHCREEHETDQYEEVALELKTSSQTLEGRNGDTHNGKKQETMDAEELSLCDLPGSTEGSPFLSTSASPPPIPPPLDLTLLPDVI